MKSRNSILRIYKYIKYNEKYFWCYFLIYTIAQIVFSVLSVSMSKVLIEALYLKEEMVNKFIGILLFFFLFMTLSGWQKNIMLHKLNAQIVRIKNHYSKKLYKKILNIKYQLVEDAKFLDENNQIFAVVKEYNHGIEGICQILSRLPANIILIIIFIGILGNLSPIIICVVLLECMLKIIAGKVFSQKMYSKKREIGKSKRRMNYFYNVSHDFASGKDIHIFEMKNLLVNDYSKEIDNYIHTLKKLYNIQFLSENCNTVFSVFCDLVMYGFLIFSVFFQYCSIADFTMYIAVINMMKTYFQSLYEDVSLLINEIPYVNDFFLFLDEDYEEQSGEKREVEKRNITFENVSFKYPNSEEYILKHVDFEVKNGEKIAIVGANGAGKSTIVKLLMKFYQVEEGTIKLNDVDIKEYDTEYLYSLYSVIFQDICMYPFTIRENITCSDTEYNKARFEDSLIVSGLYDKFLNLKNGVESQLMKNFNIDGIDLSGGEKQDVVIARALYKNAPIAILDEPISKLDAVAEENFYMKICNLLKDKTVLFISHRLTSIHFCDKIMFFKEGCLTEYGTFKELMMLRGEFYQMYKIQGKYYED